MKKYEGIIILSDLDGTLLDNAGLSDKNKEAIDYFTENGGIFTVASGRPPEFINQLPLKINAPIICANGTIIYDEKTKSIMKVYSLDERCLGAADFIKNTTNVVRISVFSMAEKFIINPKSTDFTTFNSPVNKFVFVFETEKETLEARKALIDRYGETGAVERSWATGVEIRPKSAGKGACLKYIKNLTGAKIAVGVGDYENDITLLQAADVAIAPSSGQPEIIAAADYVAAPCTEGTLADIIYNILPKGGFTNACSN